MESDESAKTFVEHLCTTSYFRDYISLTLTQERLFLNNELTYELLKNYLPKVFIDFIFLISLIFVSFSQLNPFYMFSDSQKYFNSNSNKSRFIAH
jgi:hypothetical protein